MSVRRFTYHDEGFIYIRHGTWVRTADGVARPGVGAGALRRREQLGWGSCGAGRGAGLDLGGSYAVVLFSDGGSGDRPQPDYAAGGRALCLGA